MNSSCTSRSRAGRPLIRYSLCPERYNRRPTTTSPGFKWIGGFSNARFFFGNLSSSVVPSSTGTSSPALFPAFSVSSAVNFPPCALSGTGTGPIADAGSPPSSTNFAASANFGSTRVRVTSASPSGGRLAVPLKMQSAMRSARSDLWLCSPSTQETASTMFDLPQPFGPTMQVNPLPLKVMCVFSQNDLKPTNSTLRSFSKGSSFGLPPGLPLGRSPGCERQGQAITDQPAETGSDSSRGEHLRQN